LFQKDRVSQELDEELNGFLEMAAEGKMKQGMNPKDAFRAVISSLYPTSCSNPKWKFPQISLAIRPSP
jgi:hypothetical protein